jgi:hypothetical protein
VELIVDYVPDSIPGAIPFVWVVMVIILRRSILRVDLSHAVSSKMDWRFVQIAMIIHAGDLILKEEALIHL